MEPRHAPPRLRGVCAAAVPKTQDLTLRGARAAGKAPAPPQHPAECGARKEPELPGRSPAASPRAEEPAGLTRFHGPRRSCRPGTCCKQLVLSGVDRARAPLTLLHQRLVAVQAEELQLLREVLGRHDHGDTQGAGAGTPAGRGRTAQ